MGKTSSASKMKHIEKTYQKHTFLVRFDDPLNEKINKMKENKSFSEIVKKLLENY